MSIKVLPEKVASQIAAGEVVQRPASVVKELIENAIDAQSRSIKIETKGAGKRLIVVSDDGIGIPAEELCLALARHATSKLSAAEDLANIHTLGFRGEALASIGSVSLLKLTSKTETQLTGMQLQMDGGIQLPPENVSFPQGTEVRVQDLFYNVPARLKFLKTESTENRQITGLVTRYAMAYPDIRWSYSQDDKPIILTTGSGNRTEILQTLFGTEEAKLLLPINFHDKEITIDGFISSLSLNRSHRKDITLFVNGRWVQDSALIASVIKAYNTLLMVGRYPIAILFIQIPSQDVDVNVHPSKAEVRFREPDLIFSTIQRAVRRGLLSYSPIPEINSASLWGRYQTMDNNMSSSQLPARQQEESDPSNSLNEVQVHTPGQNLLPVERIPLLRLIGQVASTYIIAEGPDGLYLIDQHAAHERVLFDQLMAQFRASSIPAQTLLEPVIIELSNEKSAVLRQQMTVLQELGFECEPFGPNSFLLRSIPAIVKDGDLRGAINSLVEDFEEDEKPFQAEIEARIAGRICRRMAVKAGKTLSDSEQKALLLDLEASQNPRTCPHGRPTMIHLSAALLERQFGRTGPI